MREASIETDPVPAPMSHTTLSCFQPQAVQGDRPHLPLGYLAPQWPSLLEGVVGQAKRERDCRAASVD